MQTTPTALDIIALLDDTRGTLLAQLRADTLTLRGIEERTLYDGFCREWTPAYYLGKGQLFHVHNFHSQLLARRVMLEYEVGDFSQGQLYLEQLLDSWSRTPPEPTSDYATPGLLIPLVVRITGVAERLEIAETIAQTIISSPTASFALDMFAKVGFAMLAVLRGDAAAAKDHYFALDSQRIPMLPGTTAVCLYRVLGLLAHTMGNLDQATGHFEDALAFCRMGNRPELAWTCCDYADTLLPHLIPLRFRLQTIDRFSRTAGSPIPSGDVRLLRLRRGDGRMPRLEGLPESRGWLHLLRHWTYGPGLASTVRG